MFEMQNTKPTRDVARFPLLETGMPFQVSERQPPPWKRLCTLQLVQIEASGKNSRL